MVPATGCVVVATAGDASVVGVASMYANRPGPGAHVASGSVIVDRTHRRRGVGDRLIAHMVQWCRSMGFAAIQFNAVVNTNDAAIRLYERPGSSPLGPRRAKRCVGAPQPRPIPASWLPCATRRPVRSHT